MRLSTTPISAGHTIALNVVLAAFLLVTVPAQAQNDLSGVLINEILADPNSAGSSQDCSTAVTPCFDTDGDGSAETNDEFVELFNSSGSTVDISGWELYDDLSLRHTFPGDVGSNTTVLAAGGFVAVVGNYDSPPENFFDASSGSLSLNNGGETVYLRDPGTDTFIAASYNGDTPTNTPPGMPNGMFEAFGSDADGLSIQRRPDGSTTFVNDTPNPAATNGGGMVNTACPEALILSDFSGADDTVELRNVGAEPVDFDVVECTLVATYQDVYVGFPLGGFTLLPTEAETVMPGALRNVFSGIAIVDRAEVSVSTTITEIQPDIIASLVYLGNDVVYGFFHRDDASFQAQCADYVPTRFDTFAQNQCAPLERSEGDGPAALTHAELTEAMLAIERGATTSAGTDALPTTFGLSAVYPNPMVERGALTVEVLEAADVRVVVYDMLGRAVAVLVDGAVEAGSHDVALDASSLASGTYLVRMAAGSSGSAFVATQRLTVVR